VSRAQSRRNWESNKNPLNRRGKNLVRQTLPLRSPGNGERSRKSGSKRFFACLEEGISGKNGLVKLEVIGGIKIVIDDATQL